MKIILGLVLLLYAALVNGNCDLDEESYQAYPGTRCHGDIKRLHDTIKGCEKACDSLQDCVGFVHSDDESRGFCQLKKEPCLDFLESKPGLTMFMKPDHAVMPRMIAGLVSKIDQVVEKNKKLEASRCAFSARTNTDVDRMINMSPLVFPVVDLNACGGYNATTGIFTAPFAGTYWFHMHVQSDNTDRGTVHLRKNGEDICLGYVTEGDRIEQESEENEDKKEFTQRKSVWGITTSCSVAVKVVLGDKVTVTGDWNPARITGTRNGFSGFLVYPD